MTADVKPIADAFVEFPIDSKSATITLNSTI